MNKTTEALKIVIILFCTSLTACIYEDPQTKCVDGKYYVKECNVCQFILHKNVECLSND